MQRLYAIIWLTWKAAFRFRLIWVISALLVMAVVLLPLMIKHDGTARGFTQILLTYTLSAITALLGISTLWLSCGTLSRDIEECQIQLVATKPIPRWQIWLGKLVGIITLDLVMLALSGAAVYFLLIYRAGKLSEKEQAILRNEVLVARSSLREPLPDLKPDVDRILKERLKSAQLSPDEIRDLRKQIEEQVKAAHQIVPKDYRREWVIDASKAMDSARLGRPLFLRVKFYAAQPTFGGSYLCIWRIGSDKSQRVVELEQNLPGETFNEFPIPPEVIGSDGKLVISFINRNQTALLFPLEEGFEVLYYEGGFAINFIRGLLIILFWLALLAAMGLAASSFLSFPVAAFATMSVMVLFFSSGMLRSSVEEQTVFGRDHETGKPINPLMDTLMLPVFKFTLKIVDLAQSFSPVDYLSAGRTISWFDLLKAFLQVVVFLGGIFALIGISAFYRRELANVQTSGP
ncbi:MAG: ABC transporter permease [Verrucomicrobiia bacterium]